MTGDLNLNNNTIVNLHTDGKDLKSAVNVDFMQSEITSMSDLVSQTIYESHITSSTNKKDAFRYLMEDVDESSSENNIGILCIKDFPESPHQINKKSLRSPARVKRRLTEPVPPSTSGRLLHDGCGMVSTRNE